MGLDLRFGLRFKNQIWHMMILASFGPWAAAF